jgi:hypothetical protein
MHTTTTTSPSIVGLPPCLWGSFERLMHHRSIIAHPRRRYGKQKVRRRPSLDCPRADVGKYSSPMKLLRTFPDLDAQAVIGIAVTLVRDLPQDLYNELVKHPYEMRV